MKTLTILCVLLSQQFATQQQCGHQIVYEHLIPLTEDPAANRIPLEWWSWTGPGGDGYLPCVTFPELGLTVGTFYTNGCHQSCEIYQEGDETDCCLAIGNNLNIAYGDYTGDSRVDLRDYWRYQQLVNESE
jgi:hypothetical protein